MAFSHPHLRSENEHGFFLGAKLQHKFHFCGYYKGNWQGLCREWALLLNVLYIGAWENQAEWRLKNSSRR